MISKNVNITTIYTKYRDKVPVIRELLGNMGRFISDDSNGLSLEILSKDLGSDIQKVTWDFDNQSGMLFYKNKKTFKFTRSSINTKNENTILLFYISKNETIECKITESIEFDLHKYYDKKAIQIEYYHDMDNTTNAYIHTGHCKINVNNGKLFLNVETDDKDSNIKSINWSKEAENNIGSISFADGNTKEFKDGLLYIDDTYTGSCSKITFELVNNKESLISARFTANYELPELNGFYDDTPEYLR